MKFVKNITLLIVIIIAFSSTHLYAITDYSLDLSPAIKSSKMFSVGYALSYTEYNGVFSNQTLYYGDVNNADISFISGTLSMAPYFEYRPLSFLEIGLSLPFSYTKKEEFNILLNNETVTEHWSFDAIHSYAKIAIIDWLISLGFRTDFTYNFSNTFGKQNQFEVYGKIFVAIVPKIIPLNLLINYSQGFMPNDIIFGEAQAALEFVSSDMLTISLGVNYMFPYTNADTTSYLEAFAKFSVFFDDYVSGNVSYSKIFYGNNVGNDSKFLINVSYHF